MTPTIHLDPMAGEKRMKSYRAIALAIAGLLLPLASLSAHGAEIKVFASTALKSVLEQAGPPFGSETGNTLVFTFGPAAVLKDEIDKGADFDVVVLTKSLNDALEKSGKLDAAASATIARAGLGVSVRAGSVKPDVRTDAALRQALLSAKSIGYNSVGASRISIEAMINRLGIADALKSTIKLLSVSAPVAVAKGEVEMGLGPISEVLPIAGAQLAGPFPADLQSYVVFSAAVSSASKNASAARLLVDFLKSPAAAPLLKTKGMQPG
jgi:molybdate transport system substrate-binding protein